MELIWDGIKEAFFLIFQGDQEIWAITWLTLKVSGIATAISLVIGLPIGTWLALQKFTGRGCLFSFINTGMAFPPVVVGLWVSIFLWRSGPFGNLGLIYTPAAMVIAQTIIATPIVIGLTIAALQQLNLLNLAALQQLSARLVLYSTGVYGTSVPPGSFLYHQ